MIRSLKEKEYKLLEEFLYQAIYIPEGFSPLERSILQDPDLQMYVKDFGHRDGDFALAAEENSQIVGIVWVRLMKDYGYYNDRTPSLSISLLPEFRAKGLGQQLMIAILDLLKSKGYPSVSLSVSKENPAIRFYRRLGFVVVEDRRDDFLMVCTF